MTKKYAVHPGYITSKNDGDRHFIEAAQLVRLYMLHPDEYIVWDARRPETYQGRNSADYIHLYPNYQGNYGRPDKQWDVDR